MGRVENKIQRNLVEEKEARDKQITVSRAAEAKGWKM